MDNADNANDGGQTWASSPSNLVRYDFNGGSGYTNYLSVNGNPQVAYTTTTVDEI